MASDGIPKGLGLGPKPGGEVADDTATSVIELSGVIKWFDVAKGYGFTFRTTACRISCCT
jgi:hypothetical protein